MRLRSAPSMKGEIIEVLPLHQPLLIMNRDNRSWLFIRIRINGEDVEGWINRAFTRAIMK
ncbi:SH3 domain-containing protein [Pantoea endophytica]|uniref:SH3 domain-containing protein n=1 Tax=Pantoea endophytica TaxID=92488 RepID=UPI003D68DE19